MINHDYYKQNKVLKMATDIYAIGAPEGGAFIVDAIVIGGNYPIAARLNYLDIEDGMTDKNKINKIFTDMVLAHWEVMGTIYTGFTSGEIQYLYCSDEENTVNLVFSDVMGMYITDTTGEYLIPSTVWTNACLMVFREYNRASDNRTKGISNKAAVIHRDKKCLCCGKSIKDGAILEVDYIIPMKDGGTADMDNLQTLCSECHSSNQNPHLDFLHT